jgi:PAS domain S-box-containing protein
VAEAVGLDIRVRLGPWSEMMNALERGEIDAIQGMFYSPERDRRFDFSQAHIVNHCVSVVRADTGKPPSSVAELRGRRIVVQEGDTMHGFCVEHGLTGQLTVVDTQEDALRAVADGTHDCALVARRTALYWIEKLRLDALVVGRSALLSPDYCFAVPEGDRALLAQLSEGLDLIEQSGEYHRIQREWMGVHEGHGVSAMAVLGYVVVVVVPLLLVVALVLLWSWSLRRRVAERTAELAERTEELETQYRLLRAAGETARFGGWSVDVETGRVSWSDEVADIHAMPHGYSPLLEEGIGFYAPEWRDKIAEVFADCAERGIPYDEEMEILTADGKRVWVRVAGKAIRDGTGRILRVEGSIQDISESKRREAHIEHLVAVRGKAEEEVQRRGAYLDRIFDVLPIGLWFADKDGTLLRGNPAGVRIWAAEPHVPIAEYGVFKAWRLPSREPVQPDDWALAKTIRDGVTVVDELLEIEAFDGKRKTILNYTTPILDEQGKVEGAIVMNLDISDRVALESQLMQAQRLESIGRLAGGVAHDFNNLLMGIMNYVELCRDGLDADHPVAAWLDEISADAQRSANLTRQLLAFARRQTIAPAAMDLNDSVAGMLKLLRRLIGEAIDLAWQPGPDLWQVRLDPSQVDQVLANLCVNARDAIGGVGKITIETGNVELDAAYCAAHVEVAPGPYVMLAVSDTGCGMDRKTLGHVFEPFFTTKDVGEGTGLGLATVHGIVKQNEGHINVYSEPGKGTTFRIYLPRFAGTDAGQKAARRESRPVGGRETILLVEDEKSVRVTTALFLEQLGYTVLTAEQPDQALRKVSEHPGTIHLLITDVVMPGMSGRDLAAKLAEQCPRMGCLFISGYTANAIAHQGVLDADVEFLAKPFTRDEIARKVREMLDG